MKISHKEELSLIKGILLGANYSEEDADTIAKVVTHSDFTGVYSHGLSRLTRYLRQIDVGALNPEPHMEMVLDGGAIMVFDGDNGSGIVSVNRAYDEAIKRAKQYGVAIAVGRRNANIGCGSYYGWRAAKDDMVCLLCCNTYAFTAPFGGADRMIGTNPIVFALPCDKELPIVLDISTTNVAMGKIQAHEREGKEIPLGWASDYEGNPTTDPSKAYALSPVANHKGYGLAVMVDALSTLFSGAAFGSNIGLFSKLEPENTGFFMLLIDPSKFMALDEFKANADNYVRMMKESRKAPGVAEIYMPGELEFKAFDHFLESGIEVSEALQAELAQLAKKLGIDYGGDDFAALLKFFCPEE